MQLTINDLPNDILKYKLLNHCGFICELVCKRWYLIHYKLNAERALFFKHTFSGENKNLIQQNNLNTVSFNFHDRLKILVKYSENANETLDCIKGSLIISALELSLVSAEMGRLDFLQYLNNHGMEWDSIENEENKSFYEYLESDPYNRYDPIDPLSDFDRYENHFCEWDKYFENFVINEWDNIQATAALNGNILCLKYLIEVCDGYLSVGICLAATKGGHLNILEYMEKETDLCDIKNECYGCSCDEDINEITHDCIKIYHDSNILKLAAKYNHLDILKYAHSNGYLWGYDANKKYNNPINTAAKYGNLECLKFLQEHNYPINDDTCKYAIKNDNFECLLYLFETKAELKKENIDYFISCAWNRESNNCFKYLFKQTDHTIINDLPSDIYELYEQYYENL